VDVLKQLLANRSADKDQLLAGMFYLAEAYEAAGNAEGAYKIYKRVVGQESDFGDGAARNKLAALESQLGIN
jgi:tetratricopeptide (TPR) repeat protein